jgi:hypothetical protein
MMELLTAKDSLDFPYCRMCKIHVPKAVDLLGCHVCICKSCLVLALDLFNNNSEEE